jgi:hypothetical protein
MVVFSLFVLPYFEDDGKQLPSYPADRAILFGQVRALVQIVWMRKYLLYLFKSNASFAGFFLAARSSAHRTEIA